MRQKGIIPSLLLVFLVMACSCSPQGAILATEATPTTRGTSTPGFVTIRLDPTNGNLMTQIHSEVQKARELGLQPFVEFDASW
jgi:hypothetical protein